MHAPGRLVLTFTYVKLFQISHLSVGWEPTDSMTQDLFTFAYHPPPDVISKAYSTLIKMLQWDKFTILYEDEGSKFFKFSDILSTKQVDKAEKLLQFKFCIKKKFS